MGDVPVRLSSSQIEDILNSLPKYPQSAPYISEKRLSELKQRIFLILKHDIVIKLSKIEELKREIAKQFLSCLLSPGTPIGVITAESIMAPITQATLNAFHFTGTEKGAVSGVTLISEMTAASLLRKNPKAYIHFRNHSLSYDEVYEMYPLLVGITIDSLRLDGEAEYLNVEFDEDGEPMNEWWYSIFLKENEFKNPSHRSPSFLRLKFDTSKLYEYKITTSDIAEKLMINRDFVNGCWCVASPTKIGIVDVFADVDNLSSHQEIINYLNLVTDNSSISDIFFGKILIPKLKYITMRGIPRNENLTPKNYKTLDIILRNDIFNEEKRIYSIRLNKYELRTKMIPVSKLITLLELSGSKVLYHVSDSNKEVWGSGVSSSIRSEISMDLYSKMSIFVESDGDPLKAISDELKKINKEDENGNLSYDRGNPPALVRASEYWYAEIGGNEKVNLEELILLDFVDYKKCYSNEYESMSRVFGIEVARNRLIQDYHSLLSDPYINSKYIVNEVNIQTSPGFITSVSANGAARQNTGTLAKASFQEATTTFIRAALYGKEDPVRDTSSAIFLGKRIALGTGGVSVIKDTLKSEALVGSQTVLDVLHGENFNIDDLPMGHVLGYGGEHVLYREFGDDTYGGLPEWYLPPEPIKTSLPLPPIIKKLLSFNLMNMVRTKSIPNGEVTSIDMDKFERVVSTF